MSNRFYTFTNQFISGSVAKSSEVNSQFQQLESGFDSLALEMNCAIKVPAAESATNFLMTQNAAARANNLLQFNASGFPIASSTLLADLSAGSHKVTNLAAATSAGDAVSLATMQSYAASLAGVPSVSGAANPSALITDGVTLSWGAGTTYLLPTPPSDEGRVLVYSGGATRWLFSNSNLIPDPDGATGSLMWSTSLENVETVEGRFWRNPVAGLAGATFDHKLKSDYYIPIATNGAWCFAVSATTTSATAGTISILLAFYDSSKVLISESAVTSVPITSTLARLKVSSSTIPGGTAYVTPIIRFTGVTAAAAATALHFRQLKLERGQQATLMEQSASVDWLLKSKTLNMIGWGQTAPYLQVGDASATASAVVFKGATGTQEDAVIANTGGTNGTQYDGTLTVYSKAVKSWGPIGYYQEYDNGNAGAGLTVNFMANGRGSKQKVTLNAATPTITISTTGLIVGQYQLKVIQDPAAARVVTWAGFAAGDCSGGAVPVITTTLSGVTFVYFYWDGSKFWVTSSDWN